MNRETGSDLEVQLVNVPNAFSAFDDALKLDPSERVAAEERHNQITDILKAGGVATDAFLQGSFARKTMLPPLHDVDKIIVLGATYSDQSDPDEVMDDIEDRLDRELNHVTFDRSRHAVQIDVDVDSFMFDAVPALDIGDGTGDVRIANRDDGTWDWANPRELIKVVANRNGATGGRFIHQVRMAKQAAETLDAGVSGLHTESIAFAAVTTAMDHAVACEAIFDAGATMLGGRYYEPTGRDLISTRLDDATIWRAKAAFAKAAELAREARRLEAAGDDHEAIRVWRQVFGSNFPDAPKSSANEAIRNLAAGGSITSAGAVSATNAGTHPNRPVRSWRER
jgi:hypothetical protein